MGEGIKQQALPTVSVVMPAYNAQAFIEQAIGSVIAQTIPQWELLVIDDCSTDDTCAIVEKLASRDGRIRLLRNEKNLGAARTRNRGLEQARGRYIAFLDSDDIWDPQKLEKQLALMEKTGADLSCCSYAIINAENEKVRPDYFVPEEISYKALLRENLLGCSTVILTGEIAKKYRFTVDFYHEDYVLWLQLVKDGFQAVGCPEILVNWRLVENSRSFNKFKSAKNRWSIYRKFLKLSVFKSICLICSYTLAGLRKYRKIP